MSEKPNELKKLMAIATDPELSADLRKKAIQQIGCIGTHEALLSLLEIVANKDMVVKERDLALKQVKGILKSIH